ncbi:tRNA (adenosine(37)-N6)-threonylcarbamoyltransferase complex dimerization subunit type 1 TsaB [Candidatus Pacearchaeota archaeon]|nr:tRNA (adenosine(37)-N6)-threonylcarbamoyltransferase complex dimerization subunit type 1 TsaB [Candidatus Pacearchaeota archaeon]
MILCIDTSTELSGVCVTDGNRSNYLSFDARHASEGVLEAIDSVIQKAGVELNDLKGVLVIKGPGSFTGLRVGIAVANQFAHQLNIPIVGIRTEEFYQNLTDESDFFYLQTMNRDQVYMVGLDSFQSEFPPQIVSVSECHHELSSLAGVQWLGQLSEAHLDQFEGINRTKDLISPDLMWNRLVEATKFTERESYDLVEPFYGKDPTITKGKK